MNRIWLAVLPIDGSIITFEWKSLCVLAEIVSFRALSTRTPTFILSCGVFHLAATMKRMIRKCGRCREMGEKSGAADGKHRKGQQLSLLSERRSRARSKRHHLQLWNRALRTRPRWICYTVSTAPLFAPRDDDGWSSLEQWRPRHFQTRQQLTFSSSGNYRAARRNGTKKSSCLLRRHTIVFISLHVLPFLFGCF